MAPPSSLPKVLEEGGDLSSIFGTDGVRGVFGRAPIDALTITRLGWALGSFLGREARSPCVIIAGDTRASTPTVTSWIAAGLDVAEARVINAGTLPTPAVAFLTRELGADAGIAVSASHNPHTDNGVKIFDGQGFKWSREGEAELEAGTLGAPNYPGDGTPEPVDRGLAERYGQALLSALPGGEPLRGLDIAVDAANGAASPLAAALFRRAGATVHAFNDHPDGANINVQCGSNHSEEIVRHTLENGCVMGIAFDGDADRVILVDETGRVLDGDAILYIWARALQQRGQLEPAAVVVTTMSNLGLESSLARLGIDLVRCGVGDREVVSEMRSRSILLGGEQSGHLVHLGLSTTGDGLLSALQIAALAVGSGQPLSQLVSGLETYPQILRNVAVRAKDDFSSVPGLEELAHSIQQRLGDRGRVLLRYSGTEPLARVMIEGPDAETIAEMAGELAAVLDRHLGSRTG